MPSTLYSQVQHSVRPAAGKSQQPTIRPAMLWIIAGLLVLTAGALLVAYANDGAGPGGIVGAAIFVGAAVALGRVALHRQGHAHQMDAQR